MAAKGKKELAFIENRTNRKVSCKRRATGLLKKAEELSVLCGVDVGIIVCSPFDNQPSIWPPAPNDFECVLSKFMRLPPAERSRHMMDQEGYKKHVIEKILDRYRNLKHENRIKYVTFLINSCLAGEKLDQFNFDDLKDMDNAINSKIKDIDRRLGFLLNPLPDEPAQEKGKEVLGSSEAPEIEMPLPESSKGKGKKVMARAETLGDDMPFPESTTQDKGKEAMVSHGMPLL